MRRFVEHTGEVELEIEAATVDAVFVEALAALHELAGAGVAGTPARHEVTVSAPDRAALLAEWIAELVYLGDAEGFVAERAERLELDGTRVEATLAGSTGPHRGLVKAVTYHDLELAPSGPGWRARVVLDV